MSLQDSLAEGEVDSAFEQATAALEKDPSNVEARVTLARLALADDDLDAAKTHLAAVPAGEGGWWRALSDATVHSMEGRFDEAEAAFRALTRAEPQRPEAFAGLAEAAIGRGDAELALKALRKAALVAPGSWWHAYRLGMELAKTGEAEEAVTHLTTAMELNPTDERPVGALAVGLMEGGALDDAEALLRDFFANEGEPVQLVALLVQVLVRKGELDEARNLAVLLADEYPEQPNLQTEAARLLLTDGDLEDAIARCEQVIASGNATATTYLVRAEAAEQSDPVDDQTALKSYAAALDLSPDDAGIQTNVGLLLVQLERLDDALVHLEKARELEPDSAEALYNLGLVFAKQGHHDEARVMLNVALQTADPSLAEEVARLIQALPA
jgi:tetratricopeptide (TPR) repeat protein